ncbi:MAG TPA: prenyltransferase [Kofleriaceae bacterium]
MSSAAARIVAFIRLGRPVFLGGGFVLYALGAVVAAVGGAAIDVRRYVLGQAVVTAFQLMTHYANDYFDYEADQANHTPTAWSGGSRVLTSAALPRKVALIAAIVLAIAGLALTGLASAATGAGVGAIGVAIAALAWAYSAPPLRLCGSGLGELDTAVVVTGLVPLLGFAMQAPLAGAGVLLLAIVPPALMQLAMLIAIEFPDAAGDAATGKRTWVVRLGAAPAAGLYAAITAAAYAWLPIAVALGLPARVALCAALPLPLAAWRIARIRADHRDPRAFERLTFWAVALLVVTSAAELAGFASLWLAAP